MDIVLSDDARFDVVNASRWLSEADVVVKRKVGRGGVWTGGDCVFTVARITLQPGMSMGLMAAMAFEDEPYTALHVHLWPAQGEVV